MSSQSCHFWFTAGPPDWNSQCHIETSSMVKHVTRQHSSTMIREKNGKVSDANHINICMYIYIYSMFSYCLCFLLFLQQHSILLHEFAASKGIRPHPNDSALPRSPAETPWVFLDLSGRKCWKLRSLGRKCDKVCYSYIGYIIKLYQCFIVSNSFRNAAEHLDILGMWWSPSTACHWASCSFSNLTNSFQAAKDRSGILANFIVLHCTWLTKPIYGYPQSTLKPVMESCSSLYNIIYCICLHSF